MSTPFAPEPKFFEHPKYAEFLTSLGTKVGDWLLIFSDAEKEEQFTTWRIAQEAKEDAEDFKNLIPMRIVMKPEEWEWFKAKIDADEEANIPNLRALSAHPPKGAI